MEFADAVNRVKIMSVDPMDIILFNTSYPITPELVEACSQVMIAHGLENRFLLMPDVSDVMSLNEAEMGRWGWMRVERMKAILENMPGRAKIYIEHLGAGA
jgi:hypothetical protein